MKNDPLIGRQLGVYRVESQIGSGGMAEVYFGWDVKLNRPVAIKVINTCYRGDPAYAERFVQEARTAANWRHENIIQVYYADDLDGLYYFAMEYIDGQNLADALSSYKADGELISYEDVIMVSRAIATGLDYAHSKGVIHRDVKPSNIFIERTGRIVLGDFGLSLNLSQGSLGEIFGTAHYIAPEQARRSNAAVPASDLYSLGVILYEMLTGEVPFDDPSPSAVALMHITAPPPPPREKNPHLSAQIEAVLLKALSKSAQDRYPSGAALIDALEEALQADDDRTKERVSLPISQETDPVPPRTISQLHLTAYVENLPPARLLLAGNPEAPFTPPTLPPPARIEDSRPNLFSRYPWKVLFGGCVFAAAFLAVVVISFLISNFWDRGRLLAAASEAQPTPTELFSSPTLRLTRTPFPAAAATLLNKTPAHTATAAAAVVLSTPTAAATYTPTPTLTLTPVPPTHLPASLTATIPYPAGRRFIFFYDQTAFYLLQVDGEVGPVSYLTFERLNDKDKAAITFSGSIWAKYSAITKPGWCMQALIAGKGEYDRPPLCSEQYLSTRFLAEKDKSIFWTTPPDFEYFRVLWKKEEVARCEIKAGICEVRLP